MPLKRGLRQDATKGITVESPEVGVSPLRGAPRRAADSRRHDQPIVPSALRSPRHTWNTSGEGPPRAQNAPREQRDCILLLAASVDVVEADDVVLAEIAADLHLD